MPVPEKLIVAFVVVLITYLQATTSFFILGPALGGWTSLLAQKILFPLNVTLISIYVNYYLACKTDPGHVPDNWEPPSVILNSEPFLHLGISGPRYCHKCECFKPPRSHHCDNPILWPWPAPSPGNGVQFDVKQNTDPLMAYYWPPKAQTDIMSETEWESQRLVRRDSEGYLVKEITLEDRIEMLQQENCFEQEEMMESEIQYCDSDSEGSDMTDYELE
ncbi:hypothetical protein G6F37_010884 [Rhizopus arrhizus]|nr:hypothetical protein G6F38_004808 [Rhizopus arrhizus]KAG1151969.1 hypothetical protein G6F37_010884 [Rhizopus arrhizus]